MAAEQAPIQSAWKRPASVKDHRDYAIEPDRDFFIPPPPEIGEVVSAASDMKIGKPLWSIPMKCVAALGISVAAFVVVYLAFPRRNNPQAPLGMAVGAALLTGVVAFFKAFKPKELSYVGKAGAVIYSTRGHRSKAKPQLVRFAEIVAVKPLIEVKQRKSMTTTYGYIYRFEDEAGRPLLRLKGEYIDTFKGRFPRHQYDFVVAAESAWKRFRGIV